MSAKKKTLADRVTDLERAMEAIVAAVEADRSRPPTLEEQHQSWVKRLRGER